MEHNINALNLEGKMPTRQQILLRIAVLTNTDMNRIGYFSTNLRLAPPQAWLDGYEIRELKSSEDVVPGDFLILGPGVRAINKEDMYLLTQCVQAVGNAMILVDDKGNRIVTHRETADQPSSVRIIFNNPSAIETQPFSSSPFSISSISNSESKTQSPILTKSQLSKDNLNNIQIRINEKGCANLFFGVFMDQVNDRRTAIITGDFEDIAFENGNLYLVHDVLITKYGIPIIVGDFHSKDVVHLPLLAALGLIPNIPPTMDWLDAHHDKYYLNELPKTLKDAPPPLTLKKALAIARRSNIGWAAMFLNATIFDILDTASRYEPMPGSTVVPLFGTTNPLGRKVSGSPHVLNFDLDLAVDYIASYGKGGKTREQKADEFFRFLIEKGLKKENYDAMLIYTSPFYSYDSKAAQLSLKWLQKIVAGKV
jgi:hypothetical protein